MGHTCVLAPALHAGDPYVIAGVLAVIGLMVGAGIISRAPSAAAGKPEVA